MKQEIQRPQTLYVNCSIIITGYEGHVYSTYLGRLIVTLSNTNLVDGQSNETMWLSK